jgi:biopolymer transport protein ExbD
MAGGGSSNPNGPITGINITPLVDVCLVLVIIFMVTAPLLTQPSLPVELPKAKTKEPKEQDNVTITISKDGKWALNETEMTSAQVEATLPGRVASSKDRYVVIRADRGTKYAQALDAMRMARLAGAKHYALATEQKSEAAP